MRKIVIIGGSKGTGRAILNSLINEYEIVNISRTNPRYKQFKFNALFFGYFD